MSQFHYNEQREVHTHHFYAAAVDSGDDSDEELQKRKRAQAELEREEAELKRNIKSLMRVSAESRVVGDPVLAQRIGSSTSIGKRDPAKEESKGRDADREGSKEAPSKSQKRQWTAPSPRKDNDLQKIDKSKEP